MVNNKIHHLIPENWVQQYADYLFNYTVKRISDAEVAKDLIQETFLAGLKSVENFQGLASERTWLISILKRKIADYFRKINSKKGKAEVSINFYTDGDNEGKWIEERIPGDWDNEIERKIETQELKNALTKCIDKLPEKYALVFKMKTLQGFETDEICKELEISSSNLWVIIHRARLELRKCLEENWFKK